MRNLKEGDRVRLLWSPAWTGKIVRHGPEQSEIRFDNGGFRIICTEYLVPETPIGREWMAGKRLLQWPTLPKEELKRRIQAESSRSDLSFEEKQLLEAARERLLSWKEPFRTTKEKAMDDTETKPEADDAAAPPAPSTEEKTVKSKSKSKKSAAKTAKPAKKTNAKPPAAKAAKVAGNGRGRGPGIDPEAKIVWLSSKENPYREGTGAFKRTELVRKASGKTAATINKISGIKSSTLNTLKNEGCIRVEK